ncbi:14419_t:CDS:2, partial [Dentiscutata erythropus]
NLVLDIMNTTKARNTSAKTDQKNEEKSQKKENDLSYYSPDEESSDSEENKAQTIELSISCLKSDYKRTHEFPEPKFRFNLKRRGLTTPEKFAA